MRWLRGTDGSGGVHLVCLWCVASLAHDGSEVVTVESIVGKEGVRAIDTRGETEVMAVPEFGLASGIIVAECMETAGASQPPESVISAIRSAANDPEILTWMTKIRRHLHAYPELSWEEFETSAYIRGKLDELGVRYEWPVAKFGIVGIIGTVERPVVALRSDMDALPIQEAGDWEHKSKNPSKMHACGHDAHVAMLLGAAKILQSRSHLLQGTVRLLFQPAEEIGMGSKTMIADGALGKASAIFGLHAFPTTPTGTVSLKAGPLMAGNGYWQATIQGRGGHAAFPHLVADPIVAAGATILVLQQLVSREADPFDPQVVSITILQAGNAKNIIPDTVMLGGTCRAFSTESFMQLKKRIEEVIEHQAAVHQCTALVSFGDTPYHPPVINDRNLHDHLHKVASTLMGKDNVRLANPMMGMEDFSFYMQQIPGYFIFLGTRNETAGSIHSVHTTLYKFDENALPHGAALLASAAETYLGRLSNSRTT